MTQITKKMHAELLQLFTRFDHDGNGHIDENEFSKILLALGQELSAESVADQFAMVDQDGNGSVQFEEFVDWWLGYKQHSHRSGLR